MHWTRHPAALAFAAAVSLLELAGPAVAAEPDDAVRPEPPPAPPTDEVVDRGPETDEPLTVSVGSPSGGWLVNGVELPESKRIKVRPGRNFGTPETVRAIVQAVDAVHTKFPKRTHRLVVGDISREGGGKLSPHASHQSGRDADIAYFYSDRRSGGHFRDATGGGLDTARTWAFIEGLLAAGDVQYIFIDYRLQRPLHDYARKKAKVSRARLNKLFAYPRGRKARVGVIRHSPGHDDHMHVRFHGRVAVANSVEFVRRHGPAALEPLPMTYRVRQGNTLTGIARKHRVSVASLRKWNGMTGKKKKKGLIKPGQRLVVGWERPIHSPPPPAPADTEER